MISSLLLIGCGKMGSAMLRGWFSQNIVEKIYVLEPGDLDANLQNNDAITHLKNTNEISNIKEKIETVVLATKPQIMDSICPDLASILPKDTLIISIAAGKTLQNYESYFGAEQPIIRSMPNTPAAIGKGATVTIGNKAAENQHKETASKLLETSGDLHWINDESLMDAVTALSGSGPAYIFYLIETLSQAGQQIGLEQDLAEKLARQTVIGAAALAEQDSATPASTLRENVTSPGGTTEAALKILMNGEMQELFNTALEAAKQRGKELSS